MSEMERARPCGRGHGRDRPRAPAGTSRHDRGRRRAALRAGPRRRSSGRSSTPRSSTPGGGSARTCEAAWPLARKLEWVAASNVGINALLFPALVESDVVVTNARGVFDEGMARVHPLGLMLYCREGLRRLTFERQREHVWETALRPIASPEPRWWWSVPGRSAGRSAGAPRRARMRSRSRTFRAFGG